MFMKKIIVLSDSHGNVNNMIFAVRQVRPDMMIHLGDCWSDAVRLQKKYPDIPMEHVPGNCDCTLEPAERILFIEGKKVMICHGHTYHVKSGYLSLELAAREKGAELVLFGHTHRVFYDWHNHLKMFNPGSIGAPGFGTPPSYGVLSLDEGTGQADMEVRYIE